MPRNRDDTRLLLVALGIAIAFTVFAAAIIGLALWRMQ
jgi:hypothetical protein